MTVDRHSCLTVVILSLVFLRFPTNNPFRLVQCRSLSPLRLLLDTNPGTASRHNLEKGRTIAGLRSELEGVNTVIAHLHKACEGNKPAITDHRDSETPRKSSTLPITAFFVPTFDTIRSQVQENKRQAARVEAILAGHRQAPQYLAGIERLQRKRAHLGDVLKSIK